MIVVAQEPRRRFRIRDGVRPYPGRVVVASRVDDRSVTGYVQVGGTKGFATAERTYRLDEVDEIAARKGGPA